MERPRLVQVPRSDKVRALVAGSGAQQYRRNSVLASGELSVLPCAHRRSDAWFWPP
jgi:hypothetical protein